MCRPLTRNMTTTSHTDKTRFLPLALGRSKWHFRYPLFPPVIALPVKQISTTTTTTSSTSWTLPTTTTTTLPYVWSLTKTSKKRRVSKLWNYRQLMAPCSLIPKIITHLTAQLNWKLPISLLILDDFFFLPPQHILFGGTKFCKWWWFHPYVLKSFPTRKVGGSDDSSYPNLTTCKSAHMFFSKLSWLKLNHQEFADLLWVDPTRSWTWKQTDRGLAIALPEAGLARGWRPTDPLGRNDMFFFQMVFFNDARPLLSIAFVKFLEKLGGIWTWLPIKINTMFFFDIFYWHFYIVFFSSGENRQKTFEKHCFFF